MFDIARALSVCIRLISKPQVEGAFYHGDAANARRALRRIAHLVEPIEVIAREPPILVAPFIDWSRSLGQPEPDCFDAVAYRLYTRWHSAPAVPMTAYVATSKALKLFGGRCNLKASQASHDLGLTAIYINYLRYNPEEAEQWRGEDVMRHTRGRREVHPDAYLPGTIVEYGGVYSAQRLRRLWEDAASRPTITRFQLW